MPSWNVKMVEVGGHILHGFMISVFQFFPYEKGFVRAKVFVLGFSRGVYPESLL